MKLNNLIFAAITLSVIIFTANAQAQGWKVSNQTPGITYANCSLTDSIAYSGSWSAQFEYQGTSTADTVWFTKHYRPFKFDFVNIVLYLIAEPGFGEGKWTMQLHHGDTVINSYTTYSVYYDFDWTILNFRWNGTLDSVDAITIKCRYAGYSTNFSRQTMWLDHFTLDGQLFDDCGDGCTITGNVFADLNTNGIKDGDEPNIPNWVIKAHWTENPDYYDSVATNASGEFIFRNLAQVDYFITQEANNCWIPTTEDTIWLSFDPLHTDTVITFGNWGVNASSFTFRERWNLVSLPRQSCERQVEKLFPDALSGLWQYAIDHYAPSDEFTIGVGYWIKLPTNVPPKLFVGELVTAETLAIHEGWNLVGGLSEPIPVTKTMADPPGLLASNWWGYDGGYTNTDTIYPAKGYWIKSSGEGYLILDINAPIGKTAFAKTLSSELPPPPPQQDESAAGQASLPTTFVLEQNYPNPFNPSTTIRYEIPKQVRDDESVVRHAEFSSASRWVTLKVCNLLGQEVATLVNEVKEPGNYSVQWNPSTSSGQIPSGIYFYRLSSGNFVETKKLLLLR